MSRIESVPASFASLGVPSALLAPLSERGIATPFPIQSATLPDTLAGRDVLGRGRTGSGKTLAFSLPLIARLARLVPSAAGIAARTRPGAPRGLVLAPTRELANQILETLEPLAKAAGLRVMTIFGGVGQARQVQQLRAGADIVVATPGRLEDLMGQGHARLDGVAITVLDEADHMADLGFLPAVTRILTATPRAGQRLLFSATLDNGVDKLVKRFLAQPLVHSVDGAESPVAAMTHHVFLVPDATQKRAIVRELAGGTSRRLLFTRTKHQARKLARQLTADGVPAVELHGNLSQGARERGLRAFADGRVRVMVATDIAARGIHVDDVDLVVHVDPPAEHKAYLHRSGRTARAGNDGDVVTLVLPEQRKDFTGLARAAKIAVQPTPVRSGDQRIADIAGEAAALVAAGEIPREAAQRGSADVVSAGGGRSSGGRSGGGRSGSGRSGNGAARGARGSGSGSAARSGSGSRSGSPRAAASAVTSSGSRGDAVVQLSRQGSGRRRRRPGSRLSA
ncbi:MAG: DEAD/DEAH box helicase [Micropruina sp.]|uniref:DEAD/DEAH box helicase n=1 Tax=Micropruina sp. TaxID=2737536 RepID=UPI0039E53DF5